jgi:hypothetical protein
MPEALEGIKQSVAALQQEMAAGKVAELQEELVALAAKVGRQLLGRQRST